MRVENKGNCTWERRRTSFQCVPEFSTLLCNEYYLEEDVIPGDQVEIPLEFMKGDPDILLFYICIFIQGISNQCLYWILIKHLKKKK